MDLRISHLLIKGLIAATNSIKIYGIASVNIQIRALTSRYLRVESNVQFTIKDQFTLKHNRANKSSKKS